MNLPLTDSTASAEALAFYDDLFKTMEANRYCSEQAAKELVCQTFDRHLATASQKKSL